MVFGLFDTFFDSKSQNLSASSNKEVGKFKGHVVLKAEQKDNQEKSEIEVMQRKMITIIQEIHRKKYEEELEIKGGLDALLSD